jgi:riboflavin synthase
MFTGIIEKVGKVTFTEPKKGQLKATIATGFTDLQPGESVAVNGVCLTVTEATPKGEANFFISEETIERSNLRHLQPEVMVNLERAATLQTRLSGHIVQGHVDATATLLNSLEGPEHHKLTFAFDPKHGRYCVEKGSITLNGVSLTINSQQETKQGEFIVSVLIIPHTWKNTNLKFLKMGDPVNVEVDIVAKYVERLCPFYTQPSTT